MRFVLRAFPRPSAAGGRSSGLPDVRGWLWPLGVQHAIVLGAAVRLLTLVLLPYQHLPDAKAYVDSGRELFATGTIVAHEYMPLYSIWAYLLGGETYLKLADIGLSLATIWLIWRLAGELFGDRRGALLAAFAAALWPHFIFYSVSGLTETAYAFLLVLAMLLLYRRNWWPGLALLALSVLVRPTLDLANPLLILVFVLIVHRGGLRQAAKRIGQYLAIYLVVMAPWWIHQGAKYDTFVRLNLGDGIVLYAGNNPMNRSGGGITGVDTDISRFNRMYKDPVARNNAMKRAAFAFIRDNPGRFVKLAGRKFVRFWRLWPYAEAYQTPSIIVVSLLSYGVMLLATLVFLLGFARGRWRMLAPILLIAAYLSAVHMLTIGSIRYRLPLEPFLIIIGCTLVARLASRLPPAWTRLGDR